MPDADLDVIRDPARLATLRRLSRVGTDAVRAFDRLTRIATAMLDAPVALVTLVEADRQVFAGCAGLSEPLASDRSTPLSHSFCQHAVATREPLVIDDARVHPLVCDNPAIAEFSVLAYAGIPLITSDGQALGSFCVLDFRPRSWTEGEIAILRDLAASVMTEIELHFRVAEQRRAELILQAERRVLEAIGSGAALPDILDLIAKEVEAARPDIRCALFVCEGENAVPRLAAAPSLSDPVRRPLHTHTAGEDGFCNDDVPGHEAAARTICGDPVAEPVRELMLQYGFQSGWSYPIRDGGDAALGVFGVMSTADTWDAEPTEADVFRRAASLAAIALEKEAGEERRRAAEHEMRAAVEHYRRLVTTAPQTIYALDPEGRFTELNPAGERLLGRSAESLKGRHFAEVIVADDLPIAESVFTKVLANPEAIVDVEVRVARPSGEERWVSITATGIPGLAGGQHGVARDITSERETQQHLRRTERLASLGTLISGVAHELNNPLSAVLGFTRLLLMDARPEAERDDLETILRETERMAKIVADLRLIARGTQEDAGRRQRVDLNDVIRHVLKTRDYSLRTRSVQVTEDLASDLPPVLADRGQMEQVLLNLVVNAEQALDAAPGERRLIVRTRAAPGGASVYVIDSGPGIATEHRDRLFDPFFTTKAPGEGTGLGLSLVHSIVKEHKGEIRIESELGRGATIRIDLPAAAALMVEAEALSLPGASRPLHVLVVDDEAAVRRVVVRSLERRGHLVDEAADGQRALELLADPAAAYDVVVSDLRMPGMSGDELLTRLRAQGSDLGERLIFLTGDTASPEAIAIHARADVPILPKPAGIGEIAGLVEKIGMGLGARQP
jgi:PAS domain S-box-containing protein